MNQANQVIPNNEADLICEALVKEILRPSRWSAKVDAWQALLEVRRVERDMQKERQHLSGAGDCAGGIIGSMGEASVRMR